MGLHATVYRNPKNLPDYLRERAIVDSKSGVMDLRDPAACPDLWEVKTGGMA